jgi:hypothetical protein
MGLARSLRRDVADWRDPLASMPQATTGTTMRALYIAHSMLRLNRRLTGARREAPPATTPLRTGTPLPVELSWAIRAGASRARCRLSAVAQERTA